MRFPTHIWGGGVDAQQERQYDVAPDGRFLINVRLESPAAPGQNTGSNPVGDAIYDGGLARHLTEYAAPLHRRRVENHECAESNHRDGPDRPDLAQYLVRFRIQ